MGIQRADSGLTVATGINSPSCKISNWKTEMTRQDRINFGGYLRQCTDAQVQGVYEKEKRAGREDYAMLAELEAVRRGIELEN